jgi:hypothetical protein
MGDLRMTDRPTTRQRLAATARAALAWARGTSGLARSRSGYAAGCAATSSGVGLNFGLGWALTLAGVLTAVSCLLLVDVEEKGDSRA